MKKSDGEDVKQFSWESAQHELQKKIAQNNRLQEMENKKRTEEELNALKQEMENKYNKEKQELEEKLKKQLSFYEGKLKEMDQTQEKSKIEKEKMNVEAILQERLKILETDKAKKKREKEIKEKLESMKRDLKIHDISHQSEKLEQNLHNVVKKLNKLKIICQELKRNVNMDIHLTRSFSEFRQGIGKFENVQIYIKVENFEEGSVYYWNTETFYNRYDMMKELFERFQEEDFDMVIIF